MKRLISTILVVSAIVLAVFLLSGPVVTVLVRNQVKGVFPGYQTSVERAHFKGLNLIALSNIEIKKGQTHNYKVKEIGVYLNPLSLIHHTIPKIYLKDASVKINDPKKKFLEVFEYPKPTPKSAFLVNSIKVSNLAFDVLTSDLQLDAIVSTELNLFDLPKSELDVKVNSLKTQGLALEDGSLVLEKGASSGNFSVRAIKYSKLKLTDFKSGFNLKDNTLFLESISAYLFGGLLRGTMKAKQAAAVDYDLNMEVVGLNLDTLINELNAAEKLTITGRLNGVLSLKGQGFGQWDINGDFRTSEGGGIVVIKDEKFIEDLAKRANQPKEIIEEGFRYYHYTSGALRLSSDSSNIILHIVMDGLEGKRDLTITYHRVVEN